MVLCPATPRIGVMHAKFEFIECDSTKIKILSIRGMLAKLSQLLVLHGFVEIASVSPELEPKKANTGAISFLNGHIVVSASVEFHTVILDAQVQEGADNRGSIFLQLLAEFENSVLFPKMVHPKIVNHANGDNLWIICFNKNLTYYLVYARFFILYQISWIPHYFSASE